jgi:MFS family permease
MAMAMPLGRLADRIGRGTVFLVGHLALLAAYACAGGPLGGTAITIATLVLLGGYYAATDGQLAAMTSQLFDASSRASAIAVVQTAQALSRFASSLTFGAAWALFGQRVDVAVFAAGLVAVLPIAWRLLRAERVPAQQSVTT